jgi:hypothetical protein
VPQVWGAFATGQARGRSLTLLFRLLTMALLACSPVADASACATGPPPFNFRIFGRANVVVNARIIGYAREEFARSNKSKEPRALRYLEFETIDRDEAPSAKQHGANLLRAPAIRGRFKAYLYGNASAAKTAWPGPKQVIVGLAVYDRPDGTPGMFVAEGVCSSIALVEDNVENMLRISQVQDDFMNWLYMPQEN